MSGYRSLKRVLGESNLERKCRWLFGICVGGLILVAFWWGDRISEGLIGATAQSQGRGRISHVLLDLPWQGGTNRDEGPDRQKVAEGQFKDRGQDEYKARILS